MEIKEILSTLKDKLLEGLKVAGQAFIETLWEFLRDDVILSARKSLELLKELVKSDAGQIKKAFIVDIIMQKIKLPLVFKPFKGLIRKMLADKIEETVIDLIEKGQEFIG